MPAEKDVSLLTGLLGNASHAINSFLPSEALRQAYADKLFHFAMEGCVYDACVCSAFRRLHLITLNKGSGAIKRLMQGPDGLWRLPDPGNPHGHLVRHQ